MENERFVLVHMDKYVYRFECLSQARIYAYNNCRGKYEYYVIVDLEKNVVVTKWSY